MKRGTNDALYRVPSCVFQNCFQKSHVHIKLESAGKIFLSTFFKKREKKRIYMSGVVISVSRNPL